MRYLLIILLLIPCVAHAQITKKLLAYNQGTYLGPVGSINCGSGLTCTLIGNILSVNSANNITYSISGNQLTMADTCGGSTPSLTFLSVPLTFNGSLLQFKGD